jgi:enoyl-CoA hydratase/carnithine racemase
MSDELLSQADGVVHRLTINRPARRNALIPEVARAIATELDRIEEEGKAELVVLRGAGGHFCAGLDLHWLRGLGAVPSVGELQHGLARRPASGSTWPWRVTSASPRTAPASPRPSPAWDSCPMADPRSPCRDSWA